VPSFIDPRQFGVSFSIKQCRHFGIDPGICLKWLLKEAGFRRLRLMSYWNEHEQQQGKYDFSALDQQIALAKKHHAVVSLCLGVRQPRWPENHWPEWAWELPKKERSEALLRYIEVVVRRYRDNNVIVSYQLENEALLKSFGKRSDVDRKRLRREYRLIKRLDPSRPVIMSTSTAWGIPLRRPIPDIVGFSYYRTVYYKGGYRHAGHFPHLDRIRASLIRLIHHQPSFIHELQLEPWGPADIWEMPLNEQAKSMSPEHIAKNVQLARDTGLWPIDLWGGEWWYWRFKAVHDPSIWLAVECALHQPAEHPEQKH
jgi:hypothetical protein